MIWRNLIKANLAYVIGSSANSAALFLLIPYLVNALPPREYGAWALFEIVILLLNMLILSGLDVGLMRDYWFLEDEANRAQLAGTILLAVCLWGGVVVGIGLLLLARGMGGSLPGAPQTLRWVLAISWTEAAFALFLTLFRIREKAGIFVILSVGRMVLFLGAAIGLIQAGHGLAGALAGRLIAAVISLGVIIVLGARYIALHPNWPALWRATRYGLPLLPTNLANYVLFASDRYVLEHFSSLEMVAIYSFAYKIATTLDVMVTRPFSTDWAPRRFKLAAAADAPRRYAQVLVLYLLAAVAFALSVVALTPTIYTWLAPPLYKAGMGTVPVILFAYLLYGLSYPLNVGIMLKDRTRYLPIIGALAAGVCLGLNLWWIPRYGLMGAAWATVVAYGFWTGGITWVSLRLYRVPYSLSQISWVALAGGVGYGGLWAIDRLDPASSGNLNLLGIRLAWVLLILAACGYQLWRKVRLARQCEPGLPAGAGEISSL